MSWCHSGSGLMKIVIFCGSYIAPNRPQCIACCVCNGVVGWANPLPFHFVENARPIDPKILSQQNGEKYFWNERGQVIGEEKYECVKLKVSIR